MTLADLVAATECAGDDMEARAVIAWNCAVSEMVGELEDQANRQADAGFHPTAMGRAAEIVGRLAMERAPVFLRGYPEDEEETEVLRDERAIAIVGED